MSARLFPPAPEYCPPCEKFIAENHVSRDCPDCAEMMKHYHSQHTPAPATRAAYTVLWIGPAPAFDGRGDTYGAAVRVFREALENVFNAQGAAGGHFAGMVAGEYAIFERRQ